jgi:hypothetical protein
MSEIIEKQSPPVEVGRAETDQLAIPSEKRRTANRENAKKSTGPRTKRGKAYSRRNAIKHGLFARHFMDFVLQNESWSEYEELLAGLRADYNPVGAAEELEVERIAQCWWRLMRANRYENAAKRLAIRDVARRELAEQSKYCDKRDAEEKEFILQLQKLSDEIDAADQVPTDLRERIIAMRPEFGPMWPFVESGAKELMNIPDFANLAEEYSPEERSRGLAFAMITVAKSFIKQLRENRRRSVTELAYDQHAIPNSDALDKILRYEAAIDRNLNRAVDRLERLQRRRKGEPVLPPVSVRLTQ